MLFVFAGCNSQPAPKISATPTWILNPNQDGKNGAVGSSMRTYDQKTSTQRKLAITRALDELSLQRGVKVEMSLTKQESYKNGNGSTQMDVGANYQTNSTITAHIENVYEDKISGELFIWMVMD
ncbi:hypothetical protein SMGD1_0834 [Sulfurimonas gotlandica GD1]|uniref:Lipoprotein n=1 Tax=Sulfurimonas gotlandica (strain DSM 19862 / JCM 16533 / GD1) TaxID=929558 RepID=H1FX51_SULGG|nr:hypothetical protein SMGD1_0834 [Sulfurimonas gotlandica GD1]